ncbi:MAG: diacylglycerol kinase [Novosphingobium pentaromativorans]|uniref:Diacylglycerol kinase n=1 Tax=Novosphingobium pentaromativorans TaxID=205844 RepID=A0A2W5QPX5_9SPHN|nr:diacylglycerol kinase family protein [Novosphingobium panipatense]PZQ53540.1 MAG: diacylglycerol kinase [Novosphingobium pentaromativorans]
MYGTIYEFETLPTFGEQGKRKATGPARVARRGRAVPLVGIIRNPRSHRNKGHAPEMADCSNILTETPRTRAELFGVLDGFARRGIDYLVVDGGDGTVRDVLTCGAEIFGDEWPTFMVLPKGKTNALAIDIGLPTHWSLTEAMAAAHKGKTVTRRPLRISSRDASSGSVQGFILGTGAFSLATEAGQEAHRRGAFNSFAVGLSVLWSIFQTLFGRKGNPWRSCTPMRLIDRHTGRDLPYEGSGHADERFMAVATTFEKFPLGARPFGRHVAPGMKLGVIDWPVRWIIALLPAILYFGLGGKFLERRGTHRLSASAVDLELGGSFILDGESFPGGNYVLEEGPQLTFVVP